MDPLISPAERAHAPLDFGHKPKGRPLLPAAGLPANRAMQANIGQHRVNPGFYTDRHFVPIVCGVDACSACGGSVKRSRGVKVGRCSVFALLRRGWPGNLSKSIS
jgi:hypothetical protein